MSWRDLSDDELAIRIENAFASGRARDKNRIARDLVHDRDDDDVAAFIDDLLDD